MVCHDISLGSCGVEQGGIAVRFSQTENVCHCMLDFSPWAEKASMELLERDQILYLQKYWQRTHSGKDLESLALVRWSQSVGTSLRSQTGLCVHLHVRVW